MKHLIVIRMNYSDDNLFINRVKIMMETCLYSLQSQTCKNFIIGFICSEEHYKKLVSIFTGINSIRFSNKSEILNYCIENTINIQTRLDSDDIIDENYIEIIQSISINNFKESPFLIQTQPYKYDYSTGKLYKMGYRYNDKITSMFLTIVQSDIKYSILDRKHNQMSELVSNVKYTDEGISKLVIHGSNTVSGISKYDTLLN